MKRKLISMLILAAMIFNVAGSLSAFAAGEYDGIYYKEVLSDDFSGDLSKWTAGSGYVLQDDDTLKLYAHNQYLTPNVNAAKNIIFEFDAIGWQSSGLHVRLENADSSKASVLIHIPNRSLDSSQNIGIFAGDLVQYAAGDLYGGTVEAPIKNSVRLVLENGNLSFYAKAETASDYSLICEFKQGIGNVSSIIDTESAYIPRIYQLYNGEDFSDAVPMYIDNVSIKTIPTVYGSVESETAIFREEFDNENWADNWDGTGAGYWANGTYYEGVPYTWDKDGEKVFFYQWNSAVYPKDISGNELTAELTLETANAVGQMIWVRFQNVNEASDYVTVRLSDGAAVFEGDGVSAGAVGGVSLTANDAAIETYSFALEADKLTVTEKSTGNTAILEGDTFSKYFTSGAEYKAGIQVLYFFANSEKPVYIDSFNVDATTFVDVQDKSVELGAKVFNETFASESWADNWDGTGAGYWASGTYYEGVPYTWDKDGEKVFFYQWNSAVYPKDISGNELTAELTLETANAVGQMIWVRFQNANEASDYVTVRLSDGAAVFEGDGVSAGAVGGVSLTANDAAIETYSFALEADKLTVTEESTGNTAVLEGETFSNYFTSGAEYKAGIQVLYFYENSEKPVYIHNFKVQTAPDKEINAELSAEVAAGEYSKVSKLEPGVSYKLNLKSDDEISGKYLAAIYDGTQLVDIYTIDALNQETEILVPYSLKNPSMKVLALEDLLSMTPMTETIDYLAK